MMLSGIETIWQAAIPFLCWLSIWN